MKKSHLRILFLIIFLGSIIGTVLQLTYFKVAYFPSCSCPADSWALNSLLLQLLTGGNNPNKELDCSLFGCAQAFFIIPVDLIIISILSLIGIKKIK